jgi:hypothetical protein
MVHGMGGDPCSRVDASPAVRFAETARCLGAAARSAGLTVPAFRSPPRVAGARRTLRHFPGGALVSVTLRDRPFHEVVVDMIEGLIRANGLEGRAAEQARGTLLDAAGAYAGEGGRRLPSPRARMAERQTQAA